MADPYFSEIKYLGGPTLDFIEITVDPNTDVSNMVVTIYHSSGNVRSTNPLAGLTPTRIGGKDVYIIDTTTSGTFNGLGKTNGLSLSDGATVYDFFSFDDLGGTITANSGAAAGLTSTSIGSAGLGHSLETDDGGSTYFVQTDPNPGAIPCLTGGTLIATPNGQVRVENLCPGDLVSTVGGGSRPLASVFHRSLTTQDLRTNPNLYPVRICEGALGSGLPSRDLLVSRQHRMQVSSPIAVRMFGTAKVLIAAVKLVGMPGIFVDTSVENLTYFHLLFEEHEVLFAEGAPTESLFLGDEAIKALPKETLSEIAVIFPNFQRIHLETLNGQFIVKGHKQKQFVQRHLKNHKPMITNPKNKFDHYN